MCVSKRETMCVCVCVCVCKKRESVCVCVCKESVCVCVCVCACSSITRKATLSHYIMLLLRVCVWVRVGTHPVVIAKSELYCTPQ